MRIKVESKMKRIASPITQEHIEVQEPCQKKYVEYETYINRIKQKEERNTSKQYLKTGIQSPKADDKIQSIKTFSPKHSETYKQPSLKTFPSKKPVNTSIKALQNKSVEFTPSINVKPKFKSPSKEIIEYNDRKGGILNNSIKTFPDTDKFQKSNILSPERHPQGKISSIKIVRTYSKWRESVDDLIQYNHANFRSDCLTPKVNNDPFKSKLKDKPDNLNILREKYKKRDHKYLSSNKELSIF